MIVKTKWFVLLMLAVVLLSACGGGSEPGVAAPTATPGLAWPEFTSDEGGFTIQLPSTPEEQVQTVPSALGDVDMHIFMAETETAAYGVMYNTFPLEVAEGDEALNNMFDSSRDGAIGNVGGEFVSEEAIEISGHPGRHIVFTVPDAIVPGGGEGYLRIYWVDGIFYQVIALGTKGAFSEDTVTWFLDSFELLP
jgi:hypothetical protein